MRCPKCGNELTKLDDTRVVCQGCGAKFQVQKKRRQDENSRAEKNGERKTPAQTNKNHKDTGEEENKKRSKKSPSSAKTSQNTTKHKKEPYAEYEFDEYDAALDRRLVTARTICYISVFVAIATFAVALFLIIPDIRNGVRSKEIEEEMLSEKMSTVEQSGEDATDAFVNEEEPSTETSSATSANEKENEPTYDVYPDQAMAEQAREEQLIENTVSSDQINTSEDESSEKETDASKKNVKNEPASTEDNTTENPDTEKTNKIENDENGDKSNKTDSDELVVKEDETGITQKEEESEETTGSNKKKDKTGQSANPEQSPNNTIVPVGNISIVSLASPESTTLLNLYTEELKTIYPNLMRMFITDGWQVILTPTLNDSMFGGPDKELAGYTFPAAKTMYIVSDGYEYLVRHEMGHYLDHVIGARRGLTWMTDAPEFQLIYASEGQLLGSAGGLNAGEFFAEVFRQMMDDPTAVAATCPKAYAYVSSCINSV